MPISTGLANNLKVNNKIAHANGTIITPDGTHHRDMSLDDERGNRR